MRLAVGTGLRSPCRASCGRSRPLVCTRMPPGRLIIAWRAKKRVEWLALSGLLYLTNSTNSRVRSTHLLHTKSPFSRFFGCRRQKSENIVVSARGRRTPQAPTLRILGCANARKYDYKSSSLYSRSIFAHHPLPDELPYPAVLGDVSDTNTHTQTKAPPSQPQRHLRRWRHGAGGAMCDARHPARLVERRAWRRELNHHRLP